MKCNKYIKNLLIIPFITFIFVSCNSENSANNNANNSSNSPNQGTLKVGLTDATTDQYQAVYITVHEILINKSDDGEESEDSWISVGTPHATYNLLKLVNGVRESLGIVNLEVGHYKQMRLIVGDTADSSINIFSEVHPFANYVIDLNGNEHQLKIPSGMQSGIKIIHGFNISKNATTELILDFNAAASVVVAGNSGQYLLKPTINILETSESSIISGLITRSSNGSVIAGAIISAQTFDNSVINAKDRITIEAATISDSNGDYSLFLSPGTYNLVFYKEGYEIYATEITVSSGDTVTKDVTLDNNSTGTLFVTSNISDDDSEAYATLSFRQNMFVNGEIVEIEVLALNIADGGTNLITLPTGELISVSSSFAESTQISFITIMTDTETILNVSL